MLRALAAICLWLTSLSAASFYDLPSYRLVVRRQLVGGALNIRQVGEVSFVVQASAPLGVPTSGALLKGFLVLLIAAGARSFINGRQTASG